MKITILIMTVFLMQVSALTKAQISIDAKQESLRKVLEKISQQSGYDFVYNVPDFKDAKPVDLKLNNVSLDLALRAAFYSQPLIYEVSDKTVMVKKKEEKSYIQTVIARFQAIDVRGKVVDSLGNGLAGATVSVKNGKGSTQTLANGDFVLKNIEEGATLTISFLGYLTKEVSASNELMSVELQQSSSKLDEVQVMAYGLTTRRLSTGNIVTIKGDEITNQPVNNPLLALQGKVPNLQITPSSGNFGSTVKIQLRGQNSLARVRRVDGGFGNVIQSEPLILIDGVPFANNVPGANFFSEPSALLGEKENQNSALSFINVNDIESIDVLSDADATAIYGSRGGSGVILITTKKSKAGNMNINFSANSGTSELAKRLNLLSTDDYLMMRKEAYINDGITVPNFNTPSNLKNSGNYDLTVWNQNRYTDWQDLLLGGNSRYTNATGSVSGGTSSIQYLLSGTYKEPGGSITPGNFKAKMGAGNFNLTGTSPDQKLQISIGGNLSSTSNTTPRSEFTYYAMTLAPNAPAPYNMDGGLNWEPFLESPSETKPSTWKNPFAQLENITKSKSNVLGINSNINYKIFDGLVLRAVGGFSDLRFNSISLNTIASMDPGLTGNTGSSSFSSNSSKSWSFEPQVNYQRSFGKSSFDVLIGGSTQSQSIESQYIGAVGYTTDALLENLSGATQFFNNNTNSQYKYNAIFGRLTYNFDQRYIVNVNVRRDGSSRFGSGRQFGSFWSIGSAWIFSNEKLFKEHFEFLSFGKLRGSFGYTGNDNIGEYQFVEFYKNVDGVYQGLKGLQSTGPANPDYSWEDIQKAELALEFGLFKDAVVISGAYWRNQSSNQLGQYSLSAVSGTINGITINQPSKLRNYGWDFSVSTRNLSSKKIRWTTMYNLGISRNKLLELSDQFNSGFTYGVPNSEIIGLPFSGFIYSTEFRGINPLTGQHQFAEKSGNSIVTLTGGFTPYEFANRINTRPSFAGGISNSFSYKGLMFSFHIQFIKQRGRNYLYDPAFWRSRYPGGFSSGAAPFGNQPNEVLGRWQNIGDITSIGKFSQKTAQGEGFITNSSAAWVNASFVRLNNAALSYSFPNALCRKLRLNKLSFYINGENLWTITPYKGLDPQTQSVALLPQLRVFTTGFNITL